MSGTCNVNQVLCQKIRGWGVKTEDGDGLRDGRGVGKGWHGINQAIPSVAPPLHSKAPSSNSCVVQV